MEDKIKGILLMIGWLLVLFTHPVFCSLLSLLIAFIINISFNMDSGGAMLTYVLLIILFTPFSLWLRNKLIKIEIEEE